MVLRGYNETEFVVAEWQILLFGLFAVQDTGIIIIFSGLRWFLVLVISSPMETSNNLDGFVVFQGNARRWNSFAAGTGEAPRRGREESFRLIRLIYGASPEGRRNNRKDRKKWE